MLLREGYSSVDANSVSYSSALSPARSLTVPHPTHDQVSRTGSADPVLRGPAKELCELIEAPASGPIICLHFTKTTCGCPAVFSSRARQAWEKHALFAWHVATAIRE